MKDLVKTYWITAILLLAPIVRYFTENATIDALTGLVVWSILWLFFGIALLVLIAGVAFYSWFEEMKTDGFEKLAKPFQKLKWWKTFIHTTLVLGAYIYIEWTGPAILYTISLTVMWCGLAFLKSGMMRAMKAKGIEIPTDTEENDLKKSQLL